MSLPFTRAINSVKCPACGSVIGEDCIQPGGKRQWPPHQERVLEFRQQIGEEEWFERYAGLDTFSYKEPGLFPSQEKSIIAQIEKPDKDSFLPGKTCQVCGGPADCLYRDETKGEKESYPHCTKCIAELATEPGCNCRRCSEKRLEGKKTKTIYLGERPRPLDLTHARVYLYKAAIRSVLQTLPSMKEWTVYLENEGRVNGIDVCLKEQSIALYPMTDDILKWIEKEFAMGTVDGLLFYVAHEILHACIAHVTGRQIETGDWYAEVEELTGRYWREEKFINDVSGMIVWQITSNGGK